MVILIAKCFLYFVALCKETLNCNEISRGTETFFGTAVYGAQEYYVKAVIEAGGIPVPLPMTSDSEAVADMVAAIDALILTGGQDIDPLLYGEVPHQNLGSLLHERDTFDTTLVHLATDAGIPVLGICRGCQIINAALGGTLYQHIPCHKGGVTHNVAIYKGSELHDVLGDVFVSNSFHHQAIKRQAPGTRITARAADGIIEAFDVPGDQFIMGIQWHPEKTFYATHDKKSAEIVKIFVDKCRNK